MSLFFQHKFTNKVCCSAAITLLCSWVVVTDFASAANDQLTDALQPYQQLQDASRQLKRNLAPDQLQLLARNSKSAWVRNEAALQLADHFATQKDWVNLQKYRGTMGPCARLQHAIYQSSAKAARSAIPAALEQATGNNLLCMSALKRGVSMLSDSQVWKQIRSLVNARQSRQARKLLVLLKQDKAGWPVLNRAIQNATARIKGKVALNTRVAQELLAVSAVVAIRRNPQLVADRWEKFTPHLDQDIAEQIWSLIGLWISQEHNADKALGYFQRSARSAQRSVELEWRVRAALRTRNWVEVRDTIAAMASEQKELSAWRYWNAYAHRQLGNSALAKNLMRQVANDFDDYYGLLAGEQTGIKLQISKVVPSAAAIKRMEANADIRLAIALGLANRTGIARSIWRYMYPQLSDDEILAAAQLATDHGWLLGGINAAEKVAPKYSNFQLRFPRPHASTIESYTKRFNLNPAFVYALIRRESRFNPGAISSAGARGIMQVMPATARSISKRHKYTRYKLSRLTRLDTNIIIGTRYLADLQQQIGTDPILIAAAYNAGPGRVRRWLATSQGLDKTVFIETIPFTETRLYVKAILGAQAHYGLLYGQSESDWKKVLTGSYS